MTKPDAINPFDDRFIDQIVDGALTPAELRAAIKCLDRQPDCWKRCAMAFLEAQCFSESIRSMEPAASLLPAYRALCSRPGARTGAGRRWLVGPIAAASVAASFALGWVGHAARPWSSAAQITTTGVNPNPGQRGDGSHAERNESDDFDVRQPPRLTTARADEARALPTVKEVIRAVASVHVGSKTTGADVPILAGPGIDEQWLKNQPPTVNEYVQVALEREGYQVNQRRRFLTTILADGRRVAVPVDQVQIRFTGNDPL